MGQQLRRPKPSSDRSPQREKQQQNRTVKMLCSRCVLPFLALYVLLAEISAAVLPSGFRNKREVNWLDVEIFARLHDVSDQEHLSVGEAEVMVRDMDGQPSRSETSLAPADHLPVQRHYQYNRKNNDKRRKVAPLDSIGSFQMSSSRNRNDEPDVDWAEYRQ